MNDGLIDAFRHDAWAMRELLTVCGALSDEQLQATAAGTYGSIIATLQHIVTGESRYCSRLTGEDCRVDAPPVIDEISAIAADLAGRWERYLARPIDGERIFVATWPDGTNYDVPDGVHVAQSIHHGNEHRAQICVILTAIGATAPALGVWDYAEATSRMMRTQA